jgi:hypothetical protein
MLGAIPGKPALGRGPAVDGDYSRHPYHHPAAGWDAAESVASVLARAGEPIDFQRIRCSTTRLWATELSWQSPSGRSQSFSH